MAGYPGNSGNPGGAGGAGAPPGLATPRGSNKTKVPGGEKRYWDPRLNKMATVSEIKNYKPPANTRQPAVARSLGAQGHARTPGTPAKTAGPPKPQTPYYGGEIPNIGGLASRLQLQQVGAPIHAAEEGEKTAALKPFQQKNAEIVNTQGNVSNRLGQLNQSNASYLQGLLGGAEGAKTANNYAAESALSAQRSVETAGQNAPTNVGGILASNLGATEQRGEANAQAMRMLAASAAARGQEEQGLANTRFATEAAKNRAGENATLEKIANKAKNTRLEAGQKLYTDLLGLKTLEQRGALGTAKNALTAEGLNIKASGTASQNARRAAQTKYEGQKVAIDAGKLNLAMQIGASTIQSREAHNQYLNASLQDKQTVANANIKYKEESLKQKAEANWIKAHGTGVAKPQQIEKFRSSFGKALNAFEESWASGKYNPAAVRQALGIGSTESSIGTGRKAKPVKIPIGRVTDPLAIQAAEEVIAKHYVSAGTKKQLEANGLPGSGWSEYLKRGR